MLNDAYRLMQAHILQEPTHAVGALDEVEGVSIKAGPLHLKQPCEGNERHSSKAPTSSSVIGGGWGGPAWCRYQV